MKLGSYVIMFVSLLAFLEFIGIPTTFSQVLSFFNIEIVNAQLVSADIGNAPFWLATLTALTAVSALGAVIVGLFVRTYDTSLVILPLIIAVGGTMISTSWGIILIAGNTQEGWLIKLVATIFIALGIGFIWSCVDYFAGR